MMMRITWKGGIYDDDENNMRITLIQCDNNSIIQLSKNSVFHDRSKHIDIRFHFLRNLIKDKVVELSYCNSQEQVADIMAKPLKLEQFLKLRNMLKMIDASVIN